MRESENSNAVTLTHRDVAVHATILHLMAIDHTKLTHCFNGRDFRLADIIA